MILRTKYAVLAVSLAAAAAMSPAQQPAAEAAAVEPPLPALPAEELHLRTGIMLLAALQKTLAQVSDRQSAQAAVSEVVRLTRELHNWAQGVAVLPVLSKDEVQVYERRYLPAIQQLNDYLRAQGERLAASDYFGVQDLGLALIALYTMAQQ